MDLSIAVSKFMTSDPISVQPNDNLVVLKHLYEKQKFHHHIPVTDHGQIKGIVSLIDFMRVVHNSSLDDNDIVYNKNHVKDIMSENPVCISGEATLKEVTDIFLRNEFHALPVTEGDKLKGIVTTTDVLRYFREHV
jgi:CBS domain-containing protein